MDKYYIGDVEFVWPKENFPLYIDDFMSKFQDEMQCDEKVIYKTQMENLEKYSKGKLLQKNGLYELYQLPEGEFIIYHWARCRFAFGFWMKDLENEDYVRCYFSPDMYKEIPLDAVRFFSCAGIHSKLLQKSAIVFHSSYVDWNGKAILFAGVSGVGKSTQARLWEKYAGTQIVNGDRTLIRKRRDKWMAYGYPCCGSSSICINKTLPIAAIVILQQGEENRIEIMKSAQQIRAILTGSEMYRWKMSEIDSVCKTASELIEQIPVIKYICNKSEDAVSVLKDWVERKEYA